MYTIKEEREIEPQTFVHRTRQMCRYVDVVNDTYNNACVWGCEVEGSLKGLASNVVPVAAGRISAIYIPTQPSLLLTR